MRLLRYGIILASVAFIAGCVFHFQPKEIIVERVYEWGTSPTGYSIATKPDGTGMIPCNAQQISTISDDSKVNVSYIVIYEQNKWFKNKQHILQLLRFERPFPSDKNPQVQSFYYRLVGESLDRTNAKYSVFTRLYERREAYNNLFDLIPESIVIPRKTDIDGARKWLLQHDPEFLQLKDKTIVAPTVLVRWKQDGYHQKFTKESPKGLSLDNIIAS